MSWHDREYAEAVDALGSNAVYGLTERQAKDKLLLHGANRLEESKREHIIIRFLRQFNDFMIIILLAAGAVSLVVSLISGEGDYADPIIILAVVFLNAIMGLLQESRAERALEALKRMSTPTAKVIRDGHMKQIDSVLMAPGDVFVLEAGDMVPADGRLISCASLKVEESALTGESVPIEKHTDSVANADAQIGDRLNMVFAGSLITYGRGTAIAVGTGMNTEMGRIASMIMEDETPETPLQKRLGETGKMLGIGALAICAVIFIIGIMRHNPPFDMFMTSISLAVAAIPEGLPAIVTIMLAMGVQRMAKRNAIVRKLPAVEALGSATVICSDKTGTLTQNKMKLTETSNGVSVLGRDNPCRLLLLRHATLCGDCFVEYEGGEVVVTGDPTEAAFIYAALAAGCRKERLEMEYPRVNEIPFDSRRKLMTTVHRAPGGGFLVITKGAPDMLMPRCTRFWDKGRELPMAPERARDINAANARMANRALRVLATAYKMIDRLPAEISPEHLENDLVFTGLAGMMDPPRPEAAEAVEVCRQAGIKPVMVTGDHAATAMAVARKVGILDEAGRAMTGEEMSRLSQEELEERVEEYSVFSRVSPEHKVRIVKAFQARGHVVAMTGDGVNDAPALKAADIGCAMGINGTEVAKNSADMVLTDDNFATIVEAVREGRGIYSNIRKAVHFLLSSNIGEIMTIFVAIVLGWDTPLLAIHLLWVNLVTDSLPAIALGLDPADNDVMTHRPHRAGASLFDGGLWQRIGLEGCMIGMLSLIAFGIGTIFFDAEGSHMIGRTMAFAVLSLSQLVHSFNMRSERSLFSIDILGNKPLVWAFLAGTVMQVSVIMIPPLATVFKVSPLSPSCWLITAFLSLMPILVVECEKRLSGARRKTASKAPARLSIFNP